MKPYGRILVREGTIAGIFFPYKGSPLKYGLYDLYEDAFGEVAIKFVGEPYQGAVQVNGWDLEGVMNNRPSTCMTEKELRETKQIPDMRFYVLERVGNARHVVSYHDGQKTHKDGSPFYEVEICGNKKKLAQFVKALKLRGYREKSL